MGGQQLGELEASSFPWISAPAPPQIKIPLAPRCRGCRVRSGGAATPVSRTTASALDHGRRATLRAEKTVSLAPARGRTGAMIKLKQEAGKKMPESGLILLARWPPDCNAPTT